MKNLILWQLHTMVRPAEAAGTRWDEIDLEEQTWTIPPERMKGRKNPNLRKEKRVPHVVPLSQQAVSILSAMQPISQHREYVFPARSKPREPINSSTANVTIKRLGFDGYTDEDGKQGSLTAHGLRSTASTACNEAGFPGHVVEAALAHLDVSSIAGTSLQSCQASGAAPHYDAVVEQSDRRSSNRQETKNSREQIKNSFQSLGELK